MNTLSKAVGIIVISVALILSLTLLRGFVLADLWGWFIVPLGLPPLSLAHAVGISVVAALFLAGLATEKSTDEDATPGAKIGGAFFKGVFIYLFAWGMGAIVHGFM